MLSQSLLKIRQGNIGLQGGGSACAFTAGVLYRLLADPTIEFNKMSGTSGGAVCGFAVTQPINKYGYTDQGREIARDRLLQQWQDIAQPAHVAAINRNIQTMAMFNPLLHDHIKSGYSFAMRSYLENSTINPNALQSNAPLALYVNAVDENGTERIFSGKELSPYSVMASGALPSHFKAVQIDGHKYWDGAVAGGSNPPIQVLRCYTADFYMFVMTNPPQYPVFPQRQSELTEQDLEDTDNLILHQAYNEIAILMQEFEEGKSGAKPVHIIMPPIERPWSSYDKQLVDKKTIFDRFAMGITSADSFLNQNTRTLDTKSSITLAELNNYATHKAPQFSVA